MNTLSPATLTASSASAWMKAAVRSSAGDGLVERLDAGVGLARRHGQRLGGGQRMHAVRRQAPQEKREA
jgi:hypothetical protein